MNRNLVFSGKARSYAREHWGSILQVQPILKKVQTNFADPAKHGRRGGAQIMFQLYYLMDLNVDIEMITHDQIIFDEIGLFPCSNFSNKCIYDGSALDCHKCNICERTFPEETHYTYNGPPISKKLMYYLKKNERYIREYYNLSSLTQVVPNKKLWERAQEQEKKLWEWVQEQEKNRREI